MGMNSLDRRHAMGLYAALAALLLVGTSAAATAPQPIEELCGVYELQSGEHIYIQPWPGGGGQLSYSDDAGTVRSLFPLSRDVFTAGPGLAVRDPVEMRFTFRRDSRRQVTSVMREQMIRGRSLRSAAARLHAYRREDVSFSSGEGANALRIAGSLLLPAGKGPFPALILIHGSGATDRNNLLPITQFLLTHGVALLGYDKRGVGQSMGGDWRTASLSQLAQDALSAAAYLRGRPEIDARRIGLFGASQGGWVAALAASRSSIPSLLVSISGPALSPAEVERDRVEGAMRRASFTPAEIAEAMKIVALREAVASGAERLETLQAALDRTPPDARWLPFALPSRTLESALQHWNSLPADYNPRPAIESLHIPVLALFGELDQNVAPEKNAAAWSAALDAGGNRDYRVHQFPGADHMLLESEKDHADDFARARRFIPAYAPLLLQWLRDHSFIGEAAETQWGRNPSKSKDAFRN